MADVAKRRIFILLAPVLRSLSRINGGRPDRVPQAGKNRQLRTPKVDFLGPRAGRALTVFPAKTGALELLPSFPVHSGTPQGTTKNGVHMPLWRYFAFSASALIALLLLADWYLPKSLAESSRAEVDKTVIRIHSAKQWPDAVVFDTNHPVISAPVSVADAAPVETPVPVVESSSRQAFAQLAPAAPIRPAASDVAPKKEVAAKKMAARHPARARAPVRRLASYQPTGSRGFFPFNW
jgi:hypothetical protein